MRGSGDRVIDQRLVRAVSHPLRVEILEALVRQAEQSPTQIAKQLDQKLGSVSYHVNVLQECEVIELVRTEPRRGAVEHFFRPAATIQSFIDLAIAAFSMQSLDREGPVAIDADHDAPGP